MKKILTCFLLSSFLVSAVNAGTVIITTSNENQDSKKADYYNEVRFFSYINWNAAYSSLIYSKNSGKSPNQAKFEVKLEHDYSTFSIKKIALKGLPGEGIKMLSPSSPCQINKIETVAKLNIHIQGAINPPWDDSRTFTCEVTY